MHSLSQERSEKLEIPPVMTLSFEKSQLKGSKLSFHHFKPMSLRPLRKKNEVRD